MTHRQPRPTLFPYTTLFRSRGTRARRGVERQPHGAVAALQHAALDQAVRIDQLVHRLGLEAEHRLVEQHGAVELAARHYLDRKSTRLNSSHTVISYAVFCLK